MGLTNRPDPRGGRGLPLLRVSAGEGRGGVFSGGQNDRQMVRDTHQEALARLT